MSLTLDTQLDSLFQYGLSIMREYEKDILNEWTELQQYLEENGTQSTETISAAFHLFSKTIFDKSLERNMLLATIKEEWNRLSTKDSMNVFILTMLESAVHRVTNLKNAKQYKNHQAIQYVFNEITEFVLKSETESPFTYDLFLQHLVYSQQLPIEWVAVIVKEDNMYRVAKWFDKKKCLLNSHYEVKSETMYELTEDLLQLVSHNYTNNILTIPFDDKQLLLSTKVDGTVHITSFVNHSLQLLQSGKTTLTHSKKEQQWKDAIMMFNESILRARNFDEALETITEGFINYLPFERCVMFSYSKINEFGFGMSTHRLDLSTIKTIKNAINELPLINDSTELLRRFGKAFKYLQPLYIANANDVFTEVYVNSFQLKSIVIIPIFTSANNELLGAAIMDQGVNKEFTISQEIYTALLKFGQSAGDVLEKFQASLPEVSAPISLSPREIEVLQLMAEGESTTSAAGILHLSEYTVRDYITSIMKKMNARNRTEAVARAIKNEII